MNIFCWRRPLHDFAEAIQPELRALRTPEPTAQLLERILRSRASGARIILPEPPAIAKRGRITRVVVGAGIAAALLLIAIPLQRVARERRSPPVAPSSDRRPSRRRRLATIGRGSHPWCSRAPMRCARSRWHLRGAHGLPRACSRKAPHPSSVTADDVDGTPAWRVVSIKEDAAPPQAEVETLYVARSDLRLLRRTIGVSPYRRWQRIDIRQRFQGDSLTGRMTTEGPSIGAGRPIARTLRFAFAPYFSDVFAPVVFMAVPLSSTWKGSASLLGWAVIDSDVFTPIELRVEGEERIAVPAGTFDCWRISVRFAGERMAYWVRRSDGLGVRLLDDLNVPARGTREVVLTRITE